jgi:putative transposase
MLGNSRLGRRILEILLHGISTRNYRKVLPQMAETVAVSKSNLSREFVEAGEQTLQELCERRFEGKNILIVYLEGIPFGPTHVIVALGVDRPGYKHVLGLREGSSEKATGAKDLLTNIVARGLEAGRRRLFVIDGSKALRKAIDEVFGDHNPLQRCRNHKIRNVLDYLPQDRQDTIRCAMKAAFQLPAEPGITKLKKLSEWLAQEYPSAAESLLEGLQEMFTINRLDLPRQLRRCLASTNIIESPNAGIREKTGRVTRWRDGPRVRRWTASALVTLEKRMRRILGHQQLWMLEAKLQERTQEQGIAKKVKSA